MSALPSDPSMSPLLPCAENLLPDPECEPSYDDLVTEDHKPVDSIFIEKLLRLLTHTLYASWSGPGPERHFLVLANVGWFYQRRTPAVVPDCLFSLDVSCPPDLHVKEGHSYYQWDMGKPPDVIIEIVSDRTGGEESFKKALYARQRVTYYAVYDPRHFLSRDALRVYHLVSGEYHLGDAGPWANIGLGLRLWQGAFEGIEDTWLRWCDTNGVVIPTGAERAAALEEQARLASEDARQASDRARKAEERNRELETELRRLKGEPSAPPPA
jgi:Uma2 family endonuclease